MSYYVETENGGDACIDALASRLLSVEKEIKRRGETDRLKGYNAGPVHLKQMEFHKCGSRNRWVFGGNRSGKTECGAVEAVWIPPSR